MTKIYTKKGDDGKTYILGGKCVKKSCIEIVATGEVDELNAMIGLLCAELSGVEDLAEKLKKIQHKLFVVGSNIAAVQTDLVEVPKLEPEHVEQLEHWIDEMNEELDELKQFILPGGNKAASISFIARAVCRRAERHLIKLTDHYEVDLMLRRYLNRLSDFLFVLGRYINKKHDVEDIAWKK
ncbi:ATP:cob(I)alamin adenosyltransferase [Candidatus Parcubacteria bacterium]|nr:MAG: ATP:cob(I)alamin adenosyltransferase [Candidatus Parcubacteria bacterium]